MALIIDPDQLTQNTTITIDTAAKTLKLTKTGALSDDGVTLQCIYSFLKEEQKGDTTLIKFPFPMITITEEKFELVNGWDFADATTKQLVRTGGWALKDAGGVSLEEYAGIITLGSIGSSDQVYYQQVGAGASTNVVLTGAVNQAVKVYGDGSHGSVNYRSYFKIFVREYQKLYAQSQLSDIGVTTMTYQVYRFPLTNSADTKITHPDGSMVIEPYASMGITQYASPQTRSIGGVNRDFHVIIDGNNGTAEQIYEFVQYSLRLATDIDDDISGSQIGKVTNSLLQFVGDTLKTRSMPEGGVFIDHYQTTDINRLVFVDDLGLERTFPYVATLILQFGDNLKNDTNAIYKVFFTNDDAGDNAGYDFGTVDAIVVNDATAVPMAGNVSGNSSIQRSFDYDKNDQRGSDSTADDAPITVVAIGLSTAQYVIATGTIQRSTSNTVSLVAALERNYSNP